MKTISKVPSVVRHHSLSLALGLTTAITLASSLPAQAEFKPYLVVGGKESITLDSTALDQLNSIGLSLASVDNLVTPSPGFSFGWPVLPPSSSPASRGTNFVFLYDDQTNTFLPQEGNTEFEGSFHFNVDPAKLTLSSPLSLGNLSVSFQFNPSIFNFDFFATDTITTNIPIFKVNTFSAPTVDLNTNTWFLQPIDIVLTQEFVNFLIANGADATAANSLVGLKLGEARGDRNFIPVGAEPVPESTSVFALLIATGIGFALRKRQ